MKCTSDCHPNLTIPTLTTMLHLQSGPDISFILLIIAHFRRQAWMPIRHAQRNKGMTQEFETLGRSVVATGCSGRHARHTLILTAEYLLRADEAENFKDDLPTTHWFAKQREAVGNESFV